MKNLYKMLEGEYKLNKFSKSDHEREILTMLAKRSRLRLEEQKKRISVPGKNHLLTIPTKASPDQILDFWLKLQGNNEKGEPYWNSRQEIEHFVNQNFEGFPGVDEKKEFTTNMNLSELKHVTWTFFKAYGKSKTKKQYENLLMQNFTKFKGAKDVYSNIKDQLNGHLKQLFK